jgi:hypothetical protein
MNACRRVWGLTCLVMPARRVTPQTIRAGAVPVESPTVRCEEQRALSALADGEVDRSAGAGRERDGDDLAALAGNHQSAVAAFAAHVLDVGAGGL